MYNNFVKFALDNGGAIKPLLLDFKYTNGTGIFNPSVYYDTLTDKLLVNIRHCQYTLYHAEKCKFDSQWGPLSYLNPENDMTLTTTNYLCELNKDNLNIEKVLKIDTSKLDVKPIWEFVGLEDVRLIRWNDVLYGTGVRRDTTTHGQGRMELSGVELLENSATEFYRYRIPSTNDDNSYCEKNWMPIEELPFHYMKWCNPTEIVLADIENNKTKVVFSGTHKDFYKDFRGGSQVIRLNDDFSFACVHTVNLFKSEIGAKNAVYRHCFIFWDNDWNVYKWTPEFSFLNGDIEFCTGMTKFNNDFILTFGFQDNCSFVLKIPKETMEDICLT